MRLQPPRRRSLRSRDLLTVESGGDRIDKFRDREGFLGVGIKDLCVDDLARHVQECGDVNALGGFEDATVPALRDRACEAIDGRRDQAFGQIAEAEIFGTQVSVGECFGEVFDGFLGTVQFVAAAEFAVLDGWHSWVPLSFER